MALSIKEKNSLQVAIKKDKQNSRIVPHYLLKITFHIFFEKKILIQNVTISI